MIHSIALGVFWGFVAFAVCGVVVERERAVWGWWLWLAAQASCAVWLWSWWFLPVAIVCLVGAWRADRAPARRKVRR